HQAAEIRRVVTARRALPRPPKPYDADAAPVPLAGAALFSGPVTPEARMTLFRTVAPETEPVSVVEVKQHLRIDHDTEDALIEGLVRAAREEVEASAGLALINQSWRLTLDRLPRSGEVGLRRHPVRSITSVTVYGADGEA